MKAGANYVASLRAAEEAKARGYAQVLWTDAIEHTYLEEVGHDEPGRAHRRRVRHAAARRQHPRAASPATRVITLLRDWGFAVNERPIGMEELIAAHRAGTLREVFGCGTAAVITPVGALGWKGEDIVINDGKPGEVSQRLFDAITDIQYGRAPDTHGWMTLLEATHDGRPAGAALRPAAAGAGRGGAGQAGDRDAARAGGRAPAGDGVRARARLGGVGGGMRGGVRAHAARLLRRGRAARRRAQIAAGERHADRVRLLRGDLPRLLRSRAGPPEQRRGRGVGKALLLAALHAMRAEGYAYAIIGWASSIDFYRKAVGATVIEGSKPGIYPAPLTAPPPRRR